MTVPFHIYVPTIHQEWHMTELIHCCFLIYIFKSSYELGAIYYSNNTIHARLSCLLYIGLAMERTGHTRRHELSSNDKDGY